MAQITYTDKVALNENPEIAAINKVQDTDMNEIKSVVNANYNNTIQITNTEPTDSDNKIWIDTGEIAQAHTEITNEYSTSTGLGYSANYVNQLFKKESNYYELPNGLVICWGEVQSSTMQEDSLVGAYSKEVPLPITYSSTPIAVQGFRYRNGITTTGIKEISTTSITLTCSVQSTGIYVPYIVIGYK